MDDLFAYRDHYPHAPGFKDDDTSREAAESIAPSAELLRERCYSALRENGPATADEVAGWLELSVLSTRPRFTELQRAGRICDTGERRKNASGRNAKVWSPVL